jgi:hypothetical protein
MTLLPDNRINLQGPLVDFTKVGTTGQAHDLFPQPGPARFDQMRSYLIALLANQSSFSEPIEFRVGSLWFDLNVNAFKYRAETPGPIISTEGSFFIDLANGILLEPGLSLEAWYQQVKEIITTIDPGVSSLFSKLTNATAEEAMSAGSIVYVSNNRRVKLTDQSLPTKSEPVGVTTTSANVNEGVVLQHIGLARVRMASGLTLSPGDKVWMGTMGRGTNDEPGTGEIRQVGVIFDTSDYVPSALESTALVLFNLGGIDTSSPAPVVVPPMSFIAGVGGVAAGAVVYLDGIAPNEVKQARADSILHSNTVVGVARNTASVGGTVLVDTFGPLSVLSDASLISAGSPVYLSASIFGVGKVHWSANVSLDPDFISGTVVLLLGYAITGTTLPFQPFTMVWAPRAPVVVA